MNWTIGLVNYTIGWANCIIGWVNYTIDWVNFIIDWVNCIISWMNCNNSWTEVVLSGLIGAILGLNAKIFSSSGIMSRVSSEEAPGDFEGTLITDGRGLQRRLRF